MISLENDGESDDVAATEVSVGDFTIILKVAENDFNAEKKTLFATTLWHGAKVLAQQIAGNLATRIKRASVIEFGAAAGLPSIVARKVGAAVVCASDYPSPAVLETLVENMSNNDSDDDGSTDAAGVVGYIWGEDPSGLLKVNNGDLYDVVLASECLWKPDTHESFAQSIHWVLKPGGAVFLTFSNHIPGLEDKYLEFFEVANRFGLELVSKHTFEAPHMWSDKMTEVFLYELTHRIDAS
jgi:nicotinamide N-methyltransferase